jgi:hypothetical protein
MLDSNLRLAKVARAYPGGHSVDLVMYDDNSPQTNVQVLSGAASTRSGFSGLVAPTAAPDGEWGNQDSGDEDMIAVVGFLHGHPVVLGFLFPQVNQMTFTDENRLTFRSPSDVYVSIDKDGNTEVYHPSGTYFRIGETKEHEDLSAKDYDKNWSINRNTGKAVHVHLGVSNGGAKVADVDIDPQGNITLEHIGAMDTTTGKHWETDVAEKTDWTSGGRVKIVAPLVVLDADVKVTGKLRADGGIASGGDVSAGGGVASMLLHKHRENGEGAMTDKAQEGTDFDLPSD